MQSKPTVWWCLHLLLLASVGSVLSAIALTCRRYVSKASVIWSTVSLPAVALGVFALLAVFSDDVTANVNDVTCVTCVRVITTSTVCDGDHVICCWSESGSLSHCVCGG